MKKRWIVAAVLMVVLIGGFILRNRMFAEGEGSNANGKVEPEMLMKVEKGEIEKTVTSTGYLQPIKERVLAFAQNGKITDIRVAEGDQVKEGKILVKVDLTAQNYTYLNPQGAGQMGQGMQGILGGEMGRGANQPTSSAGEEGNELKAPFGGRVAAIYVEEGDVVSGSNAVLKLVDDSKYEIKVNVDESESRLIKVGQPVTITLDAMPGEHYKGEVKRIAYETENNNGFVSIPVTIALTEKAEIFRPGLSAELNIIVDKKIEQLIVPVTAVFNDGGVEKAVKYVNGVLEPTPVKTGLSNGMEIVILEGLTEGDQILKNTYDYAGIDPNEREGFMMGGGRNRSSRR